ncbi:hypothetical protein D3C76_695890 [compost metagenome]
MHAGHAGHVLVQQDHIEVVTQVRLGAQQRQRLLARGHGAHVQAPGAALLHQHLATGVVVIHHQHPCALQRAIEVRCRVLQAVRVQRQGQPQGTALVVTTLDAEFALHQANQLTGDHQPQITAQVVGREEMLAVQFGVHQRVALFGVHRFAAVLHGDAQAWMAAAFVEGDDDQDLAFVGFLQRVFQQAQQCLAQARRITADDARYLWLNEADQFDVLLLGLGAEDAQAVFDQGVEIELHIIQFDLSGLEFGNVENFVDQGQQFVAGAVDGLHIVALLDRQWRAQQQLGHAQYAVHRGADLMADLRQELGLGIDLGVAGRQVATDAETSFGDAALAFAQGNAHQQATDADEHQQGGDQVMGFDQGQPQQGGQDDQGAQVEHHHGRHEQPRRAIAFLPVIGADEQHAQAGQCDQCVGDDVQWQRVDEQQQQAADHDEQDVAHDQLVQRMRSEGLEETIGKHQAAGGRQQ